MSKEIERLIRITSRKALQMKAEEESEKLARLLRLLKMAEASIADRNQRCRIVMGYRK